MRKIKIVTAEDREQFQAWLAQTDGALEIFLANGPEDDRKKLDFTPASLVTVEARLLRDFLSFEATQMPAAATRLDGYARYIGEVFRRSLGGAWCLSDTDPQDAYYGLPIWRHSAGTVDCPLALATAATDRRTGMYLRGVYGNTAEELNG